MNNLAENLHGQTLSNSSKLMEIFCKRLANPSIKFLNSHEEISNEILYLERIGKFEDALIKSLLAALLHRNPVWQIEAMCILIAHNKLDEARYVGNILQPMHAIVNKIINIIDFISNTNIKSFRYKTHNYKFYISGQNWEIEDVHINNNFYEPEEIDLISKLVPENGIFIDIGANVGNHSIYLSKNRPDIKIIPIEPEPRAVALLKQNVILNECKNIDVSNLGKAISTHRGHTYLQWKSSITSTHPSYGKTGFLKEGIKVPNILIEDVLCKNAFIKLDVEGIERFVLQDSVDMIKEKKPYLMIEILDKHPHNAISECLMGLEFEIKASVDMKVGKNVLLKIM